MWKQLFEFGKQVLALKQQVAKNTKEIEELRKDLNRLAAYSQKLSNNL